MKKWLACILAVSIILSLSVTVFASTSAAGVDTNLYFTGGSAECYCSVSMTGKNIDLTMKLYRNGTLVRVWNDYDYGYVEINESYPAVSGSTYRLDFTCYANGSAVGIPSITKVCP